jgi:hypothetical protein
MVVNILASAHLDNRPVEARPYEHVTDPAGTPEKENDRMNLTREILAVLALVGAIFMVVAVVAAFADTPRDSVNPPFDLGAR